MKWAMVWFLNILLGRWFRDVLGLANQRVAKVADAVVIVVVGIPQVLKGTLPNLK